ncbi:hypothetical protein GCM10028781_12570 [Nostocoides australiense]
MDEITVARNAFGARNPCASDSKARGSSYHSRSTTRFTVGHEMVCPPGFSAGPWPGHDRPRTHDSVREVATPIEAPGDLGCGNE